MTKLLSMIVAKGSNGVIGNKGELPWHLPHDLQHFKRITEGKTVIMGRKTFESIGRPLPNRTNVVLTGDKDYEAPVDVVLVNSFRGIKRVIKDTPNEVIIIGGEFLYSYFIKYADRLYVTEIDETFEGDTYFPEIPREYWEITKVEAGPMNIKTPYKYFYCQYDRRVGK